MIFFEHPAYIGYVTQNDSVERREYFSKQFNTQGFDDSALWSLDHTIVKFVLPRLKAYNEKAHDLFDAAHSEKLLKDIQTIINGFELYLSPEFHEYDKKQYKKYKKAWKKLSKIHGQLWY
jgi:hypothetical protein